MTRNRLVARGAIATASMLAAYVAGWFVVAHMLKAGIADWAADRRLDGWVVEHGAITMAGFPFSWRADIETPYLAETTRDLNISWSGPHIALNWKPWNPRALHYATSGTHEFLADIDEGAGLRETTLEMARARGDMVFGQRGGLERLTILLDNAGLSLPTGLSLRFNGLRAAIDNNPSSDGIEIVQPHLIPSFRFHSEIFGLTLPEDERPPLGRTIGRIALDGTIMGRIPPGRPSVSLPVWRKDGGTVEISHLDLGWGPLVIQATGTMALDSDLQPIGALTGTITGHDATLMALVGAGLLKPGMALVGKVALSAFARTPNGGGQPEIEVPITLQDGWLYVGRIKLVQVPTVRWK